MPAPQRGLTNREKTAIFALCYGILPDWKTAFIASQQKPETEVESLKGINPRVTLWKKSEKVRLYWEYCTRFIADKEHDARERGRIEAERNQGKGIEDKSQGTEAESERSENKRNAVIIDYSDPRRRKDLYNKIIRNAVDDPKTQLDAAKVLEQLQRDDRQAANEQKQVRAYLPIVCNDCPLYQKSKNRL